MSHRFALVLMVPLAAGAVWGQGATASVRIFSEPAGQMFFVDGALYTSSATFLWPAGSKHILSVDPIQTAPGGNRFTFQSWQDSSGLAPVTTPVFAMTANPNITFVKLVSTLEHPVTIKFFDCPQPEGVPCTGGPGTVFFNGEPITRDTVSYIGTGGQVTLRAVPNEGFVFTGWSINSGPLTAVARTVLIREPTGILAHFAPGKRVTFVTEPGGLDLLVNRTNTPTPATLDLAEDSRNVLGANSPQTDRLGKVWIFDRFDIGGGQNTEYVARGANIPATIRGLFLAGVRVSFLTEPLGLSLEVNGRSNYADNVYNFVWAVGSTHTVTAPAENRDRAGRRYRFAGWSNQGPASQQVSITEAMVAGGLRLTARYELLDRVTVTSSPAGQTVIADGQPCRTPCVLDRARGSEVRLSAAAVVPVTDVERLEFDGWSDGGGLERPVLFQQDVHTVQVRYRSAFRLLLAADPVEGAAIRCEPESADGFYRTGTNVSVTAAASDGYRFRRWEGDAEGTFPTAWLPIHGPRMVRAILDRVPFIAPAGVRNAASELSEPGVAPGSLIAVAGANLAGGSETAARNPLPQSLAGVTVRIDNRLLALIAVSPERIVAQLPWDLAEGPYRLVVGRVGQPEVTAPFTVVRNAPGLFARGEAPPVEASKPWGVFFREDGTPVTAEKPARRGERIRVWGTGFGPLERRPPEGFPVPAAPPFAALDTVEILAGDAVLTAEWAGAEPGEAGVMAARFLVTDAVPAASTIECRVRVNERLSNVVLLPVE